MIIFNIDTSTDACSAAVTDGGRVMESDGVLLSRLQTSQSEHASLLPRYIDELLDILRKSNIRLDAVAVSAGPGSYTGLRIGASAAKGLAYGFNIPLLAVPTLQIMAATSRAQSDRETRGKAANRLFIPMIDARRMEVYTAVYDAELNERKKPWAEVVTENSFADLLQTGACVFSGNGMPKCRELLEHSENAVFIDNIVPDAAYMGTLAEELLKKNETADTAYWTPFYLKEFEAKHSVVKGL